MVEVKTDYNIFFEFIKRYSLNEFRDIDINDDFMVRLNNSLSLGRQFFYIGDVLKLKLLYTSPQVLDIFGIEPEKYDLTYNFTKTHPSDIERRGRMRVKVINKGQELFLKKADPYILSSNFRIKNINGEYLNTFGQCYLFYIGPPVETTFLLLITTLIDSFSKILKRNFYHWYSGNDMKYFRYPDEELLLTGSSLSEREIEILRYIHMGMDSKEISRNLNLSLNTISTHRKNILKKSGKTSIGELIYELEGIGLI